MKKKSNSRLSTFLTIIITVVIFGLVIYFSNLDRYIDYLIHKTEKAVKNNTSKENDNKQKKVKEFKIQENPIIKKIKNAMDYMNSDVRGLAVKLALNDPGEYNINQVCDIYSYCLNNWKYVNDPAGSEYIAKASESVKLMGGDCDDFAVMIASLIQSIGGSTRVVLASEKDSSSGHCYAEVYISDKEKDLELILSSINDHYAKDFQKLIGTNEVTKLHYTKDKKGIWLNLDYSSKYPGGEYYKGEIDEIIYPE